MHRILIFLCIYATTMPVLAIVAIDSRCMNECTAYGYTYQSCIMKCKVADVRVTPNVDADIPGVMDGKCFSDCTVRGGEYNECKKLCSH